MKMVHLKWYGCISLVALVALSSVVSASDAEGAGGATAPYVLVGHVDNTAVVGTQAFANSSGRVAVNQSAGDINVQSNTHAIAGKVVILSDQSNPYLEQSEQATAHNVTAIEDFAFENAQGLISINQVSGQGNVQANLGAIALQSVVGFGLDDSALETVASPTTLPFDPNDTNQITIATTSLDNAQGIVQINQISGDGNTAINRFSLQLPSGN